VGYSIGSKVCGLQLDTYLRVNLLGKFIAYNTNLLGSARFAIDGTWEMSRDGKSLHNTLASPGTRKFSRALQLFTTAATWKFNLTNSMRQSFYYFPSGMRPHEVV
jgi:hypothetical protein